MPLLRGSSFLSHGTLPGRADRQGAHEGHHHYISIALVADIEGNQVRLSANADVAVSFEEESDGGQA
ncbi:DUF2171 domain-containing protein [Microvirga sp. VF16]|uniref:DUF2171 domain-containing protein n=1 Tax=Microvirga sp. VF16 TaxID=2807101 RepID=UPI00193EA8B2|nr:DUF2171 domain-containing protein [Microvirga sp. VF16]QRM33475.1 DUF2171 domain-containing protein [Microvirga sp. VF16]